MPYIGYFELISKVDKIILLDDVNFIKKGWVNRNKILVNGNEYTFTIPTCSLSQNVKINTLKISNQRRWREDLIKTIKQNYKKSPYFENFSTKIFDCINFESDNLKDYLSFSISNLCANLNIKTPFLFSSNFPSQLMGQDRIIELCKIMRANEYLNLPGGKKLYSEDSFIKEKIRLSFINTHPEKYNCLSNYSKSNLSIIHFGMFNDLDHFKFPNYE